MYLAPLKKDKLPEPLPLKRLLGPSFILLGLGLGSGELILWPYLSANFGMGIIWGAVIGITFQFFLNMEIERYTLVTGESIFVGLARLLGRASPVWFILATLIPWMWPGIIASSATLFAALMGITYSKIIPIAMLLVIGLILTLGPVLYKTQEALQRTVILVGVPFILVLSIYFAAPSDWTSLFSGMVGKGEGYWFLPRDIPIATFLAALAYAGAGGTLNLAQSLYAKEKGYGMGKYSGRITSLVTGKKEKITLEGTTFDPSSSEEMAKFNLWWKRINIEHMSVFWITGAITMLLLSLLSFSTVFGHSGNEAGITFVINQGREIASGTTPFVGSMFLATAGIMLFFTQFSVLGSTSRIMSENLAVSMPKRFSPERMPTYFYGFLWLQILAGVAIFASGFTEPLELVVTGAVLNAFSMFVYSGLVIWLNRAKLPKEVSPNLFRTIMVTLAFLFYGAFSVYTIITRL